MSSFPTTNLGSQTNLYVGNGSTTLIQFDLSTLPAGTTASQVAKATLTVFVNRINSAGTVSVYPVTGAWTESSVTYATAPTMGSAVTTFTPSSVEQFLTLDVTSLVQSWVTTPASNFGLALGASTGVFLFDSKENDQTAHAPRLDVTLVSQGLAGQQGPQGIQGIQGLTGPQGIQGVAGPQGPAGLTGATGATGPVGAQGATGPAGSTGAVGPQGATGPAGPPVNFRGTYSATASYAIGDAVAESGTSYISLVSPNLNHDPVTDVAASGGHWAVLAAQGAQGVQGVQGPIGATGPQGNQGVTGPQGATGQTGATGSTGPAGPQGATGPAGPAGPTGSIGPQGNTGPAGPPVNFRGTYSAAVTYAVGDAVAESGSSYISLVSPNLNHDPATDVAGSGGHWAVLAAQGVQGVQGPIGPAGPQGNQGVAGPQGATGPTGATGSTGQAGPQGATGPAGPTGPSGAIGPQGNTGPTGPPVNFHGTYSALVTYAVGDAVAENGSSYISLVSSNAGNDPATDVTASGGHWAVLAAQGTISYRGVYSSTTAYPQNAVVSDASNTGSYVSLVNGNLGHSLPASGATSYWAVLAAQGAQGPQGPQGATGGGVQTVSQGTVTQGGGTGTLTVGGTATNPSINVNFPAQGVQSVSAGAITQGGSTGTLSVTGGSSPSININFPAVPVVKDANGNALGTLVGVPADTNNNRIRKVAGSTIDTVAGNGTQGYSGDNGLATAASLDSPQGVAVDAAFNIYIGDTNNERVRMVTYSTGMITTVAGNGTAGYSGDGGAGTSGSLDMPTAVAVDANGNVYVADSNNQRIRMIGGGNLSTVVGDGTQGYGGESGTATSMSLDTPRAVADSNGSVVLADTQNDRVVEATGGGAGTIAGQPPVNAASLAIGGGPRWFTARGP